MSSKQRRNASAALAFDCQFSTHWTNACFRANYRWGLRMTAARSEREAWKRLFDHDVFNDQDPASHIPVERRNLLGPLMPSLVEQIKRKIRSYLWPESLTKPGPGVAVFRHAPELLHVRGERAILRYLPRI